MLTVDKILADLEKYCFFSNPEETPDDQLITEDNFNEYITEPLCDSNAFLGEPYEIHNGKTKICIVFDNLPFVVKIPILGFSNYDYDENGDYVPAESYRFDCDYCEQEAYISDLARDEGLSDFFATEYCAGYINNYPIYIQEKAEVYETADMSAHPSASKECYNQLDAIVEESEDNCSEALDSLMENEVWLAQALAYHGEEEFKRFIDFLAYNDINDLHDANIGYIDARPVLLDYSGYQG